MTRYEELCEAHFAAEPRLLAIDAVFRELPLKMKQALTEHLEVPTGAAEMPTALAGRPTSYVEIYRQEFDQNDKKIWEPCSPNDYLQVDGEGICHFTIGICAELKSEHMLHASMMFLEFTIESVDEQSAELQFAKTGYKIPVDLCNPTGYADAAALVTTYLLERMKNPPAAARGLQGRIGF
jgi:hypothetical protein